MNEKGTYVHYRLPVAVLRPVERNAARDRRIGTVRDAGS